MRRICTLALICLLSATTAFPATRKEVPGAWYTDALVSGQFVAAIRGGGLVTNITPTGVIASPETGDGLLYVRLNNDGTRFAGQSHAGKGSWEWSPGWRLDLNPAFGVSGLIYDLANVLRFAIPGVTGSQGYRYVQEGTGALITGDATYSDPARRIWEWSTYGDVTVGQGEAGCISLRVTDMVANGVRVLDRRLIEPGDCRFVRFHRSGDLLAISMVKLVEGKSVILWLTADELASFPPEPPAGAGTPPPPPLPTPLPAAPHLTAPQLASLKSIRARYPETVTPAQIGAILNEVAWLYRNDTQQPLGLEDKPGGTAAIQPTTGRSIWNGLRLIRNGLHYGGDVCGACSVGRFEVIDAEFGGPTDPAKFVAPVAPSGSPDPTPVPVDPELAALRARVAALELQVAQLTGERDAATAQAQALTAALNTARQRIAELEAQPAPTCTATVRPSWARMLGIRASCEVIR